MAARVLSSIVDRLELVRLIRVDHLTKAQAAIQLGLSEEWARKWWRRYRRGGESALLPSLPLAPGPLSRFSPAVAGAALAHRQTHPLLGARRTLLALQRDESLRGERLPGFRTIHRAWKRAGLIAQRLPRDAPPPPVRAPKGDAHALWQIDHQDHLACKGVDGLIVLQSIRAPAAGLTIGADLFPGPHGAHAVPEDDLLDALRQRLVQWGRPLALSVDRGI